MYHGLTECSFIFGPDVVADVVADVEEVVSQDSNIITAGDSSLPEVGSSVSLPEDSFNVAI